MAEQNTKHLTREVWAWIRRVADRDHGGDTNAAMAAILTAAWQSEQEPGNPWAYLEARVRSGPPIAPRQ